MSDSPTVRHDEHVAYVPAVRKSVFVSQPQPSERVVEVKWNTLSASEASESKTGQHTSQLPGGTWIAPGQAQQ
ncbi:uncharacterized protein SEPMUDRAFT_117319 [Sphaerulina musiva SO2202]|uniref:Uncharacterized protein n=1 Tax=Sphaerulina musiva (strain SO2202) TaxID=692275 RepID=M3D3F4_SPHMS|nr:uncharacterized protein SEPMUDRAFT_117319 [Sphaerulina musiva SO2202]EMF12760.1 hypothetical protein SEPMUDRAFT_117319 [Sphaerulina musiva SO2202]